MLARRAIGMVTTHDLALTEIAAIFPARSGTCICRIMSKTGRCVRLQAARRRDHPQQRARIDAYDWPGRMKRCRGRHNLAGSLILAGTMMLAGRRRVLTGTRTVLVSGMLEQAGWNAIKTRRFQGRRRRVQRSDKLDPKNAHAVAGRRHGRVPAAPRCRSQGASASSALALDPKLTVARAQLAQVVRRQGDLTEAIRLYEIVAAEEPDDAGVRDTLDGGSARRSCTSACGSRSAITSLCRSRAAKMPRWRRRRSSR